MTEVRPVSALSLWLACLPLAQPGSPPPWEWLIELGRSFREALAVKPPAPDEPPAGVPRHAKAVWEPQLQMQPDPGRGGKPGPVLVGRLYLFDEQVKHTMACEGSLIVDLYDGTTGQEVMLEEWRIDSETLRRLLRRDLLGWGYTVGLPWTSYRPEVARVVLKLRFDHGLDPSKGPLFDSTCPMPIQHPDRPAQVAPPLPQCKPGPRASS
jgi:hypothetical protein